jgi:CubicO group peptidase (beta-lactamase class C family)
MYLTVITFLTAMTCLGGSTRLQEGAAASAPAGIEALAAELDRILPGLLEKNHVPGAAVAVLGKGRIALERGYGLTDRAAGTPVTSQTGFNVGSVSKTVAAWGVMHLVDQGKLDLDAPVEKYLTRWHLPKSRFDVKEVTVRRLLSHTAGLSLHGYPGWEPEAKLPTIEQSLSGRTNGAGEVCLIMEPGTQWKYSGGGYTLLQLLIEEVTGRDFCEYMEEKILTPLGMHHSSFEFSEEILAGSSVAHDRFGNPVDCVRFTARAAAGLHTTLEDLSAFALAAMEGADNASPGRGVLEPATVALMLSSAPATKGIWGLGYIMKTLLPDVTAMGHTGGNEGWVAEFWIAPKTGDGVVALTNSTDGGNVTPLVFHLWYRWLIQARGLMPDRPNVKADETNNKYLGTWKGKIDIGDRRISFTIELGADADRNVEGTYTTKRAGTLDLKAIELSGNRFEAHIEGVAGSLFQGTGEGSETIAGDYYENGKMTFFMKKVSGKRK